MAHEQIIKSMVHAATLKFVRLFLYNIVISWLVAVVHRYVLCDCLSEKPHSLHSAVGQETPFRSVHLHEPVFSFVVAVFVKQNNTWLSIVL